MTLESVTLIPPSDDRPPITLADVLVRSMARSRRTAVLEVPLSSLEATPLADLDVEPGASIVVTTTDGKTYSGYVEVVAEGTASRFYWCGLAS